MKKKPLALQKDPRITAPLISWKVALIVFGIIYLLVFAAIFIYSAYITQIGTMIAILTYYLVVACVILAVLLGVFWRYFIGKPIRKVATAARKVASGDFEVQLLRERKDGKKNEIDVLFDDFNTMAKELKSNEMLKSDFVSNVSHEIKTPLSVILSYSKALRDNRVEENEKGKYIDVVISSAEKLNIMIANILKLSKLENQQIFPAAQKYQLGEQLRKCSLGYMDKWQEKDIDFTIDVADVEVAYDASLLEIVWDNLVSNAIKFTDNGGRISVTSKATRTCVSVTVEDTGCGMDEETQKRVYEKFYQGDTSHSSEGNGLGLALVKKIVDIVGGNISMKSTVGKGTAFTVELKI